MELQEILMSIIGGLIILLGFFSNYWFNRNNKQLEDLALRITDHEKEMIRYEERHKSLKEKNSSDYERIEKDISNLTKNVSNITDKWVETIELAKKTIGIVKALGERVDKLEEKNE